MKYINVESDFKLLESFDCNCEVNLKDSEFTFVYYTKQYSNNSKAYKKTYFADIIYPT